MSRPLNPASGLPESVHPASARPLHSLDDDPNTDPRRISAAVPSAWLDQLLAMASELPIEDGAEAVAKTLVEAAHRIVANCRFAFSVGDGLEVHQTRMFPEAAAERVVPLPADPPGFAIHVAADDASLLHDRSPVLVFVDRMTLVLTGALRTIRLVSAKGRESLELQGQIIQSEKLASLGEIAAGVVHELNNPLTCIVGYSDYLYAKAKREGRDSADVDRLFRINEAAARILRLSRDLIAYARPSVGKPAPTPIHSVIDQALVFCEHLPGRDNVAVDRRFGADVTSVLGVRDQLIQVFVNLLTNAYHSMHPQGGSLSIRTETSMHGRAVRIIVVDTGIGIKPDDLPNVFEPFYTTKKDGLGTGLGLSIVRNIVLFHGGTIAVESVHGRGTTFVVDLPVAG
jgi:two-component system, NtrC family, sensor kinase